MRIRLVGVLLVSWLVATVSAAQRRPVFTGMWKFAGDKSTAGDRAVLGDEIRITRKRMRLCWKGN